MLLRRTLEPYRFLVYPHAPVSPFHSEKLYLLSTSSCVYSEFAFLSFDFHLLLFFRLRSIDERSLIPSWDLLSFALCTLHSLFQLFFTPFVMFYIFNSRFTLTTIWFILLKKFHSKLYIVCCYVSNAFSPLASFLILPLSFLSFSKLRHRCTRIPSFLFPLHQLFPTPFRTLAALFHDTFDILFSVHLNAWVSPGIREPFTERNT